MRVRAVRLRARAPSAAVPPARKGLSQRVGACQLGGAPVLEPQARQPRLGRVAWTDGHSHHNNNIWNRRLGKPIHGHSKHFIP